MTQNLLSVDELAESLNVPKSWVYSRSRETGPDAIPRIKVGKYVRFELDKVFVWLKKQSETEWNDNEYYWCIWSEYPKKKKCNCQYNNIYWHHWIWKKSNSEVTASFFRNHFFKKNFHSSGTDYLLSIIFIFTNIQIPCNHAISTWWRISRLKTPMSKQFF